MLDIVLKVVGTRWELSTRLKMCYELPYYEWTLEERAMKYPTTNRTDVL